MDDSSDLIFILGIMPRSGTNYLNNLLLLHPECEYPGFVWEDYLLAPSQHLNAYVQSVSMNWTQEWEDNVEKNIGPDALMSFLGAGLSAFIKKQFERSCLASNRGADIQLKATESTRLVSATPSVINLKNFHKLFPRAKLLIVVRDGRSVITSGMKTFGWTYDQAVHRWANAASTICSFRTTATSEQCLIVRYEDIYADNKNELTNILNYLELDLDAYDFHAAANLAVMGSSDLKDSEGKIHWEAQDKKIDFKPVNRWENWEQSWHERYNWVAGRHHSQLGYTTVKYENFPRRWKAWNKALDAINDIDAIAQQRAKFLSALLNKIRNLVFSLPERLSR